MTAIIGPDGEIKRDRDTALEIRGAAQDLFEAWREYHVWKTNIHNFENKHVSSYRAAILGNQKEIQQAGRVLRRTITGRLNDLERSNWRSAQVANELTVSERDQIITIVGLWKREQELLTVRGRGRDSDLER